MALWFTGQIGSFFAFPEYMSWICECYVNVTTYLIHIHDIGYISACPGCLNSGIEIQYITKEIQPRIFKTTIHYFGFKE